MRTFYKTLFLIAISLLPIGAFSRATQTAPQTETKAAEDQSDWIVRFFETKYAAPYEMQSILSVFNAEIRYSTTAGGPVFSVKAAPAVMDAIAETIKRFDVPPPPRPPEPVNERVAELAIYVVVPTDQPTNSSLPPQLRPVLDQINTIFTYKGFKFLDTLLVRAPARGASSRSIGTSSGTLTIPDTPPITTYDFSGRFILRRTATGDPYLYLEGMDFRVKVPRVTNPTVAEQFYAVGIHSDVEIRPGQHVVVGKTSVENTSFILVMSVRFPDTADTPPTSK